MAALPDKDKLLRNFSRCANWEEKYLYIIEFDVRPWFEKMALTQHLTPSRSQGLEAMIRAIRAKAANIS